MVEGAHTIAAIVLETVVGTNGILVPPDGYLAGRARAVRRARHRDDRRRGDGRVRPLRRVVRRRPLGRRARPDLLRQGRQLRLRAARRRDHQPARSPTVRRRAPYPGGLTYSGHPLACASAVASINIFKEEGIIEHARHLGDRRHRPGAGRDGRAPPVASARCAASACSGRSSWSATARPASRSCRTTPPAPAAAPMAELAAACKRARPVAVHPLQPPARRPAAHDQRRRDARGPGDHRRGARRRRRTPRRLTPSTDSTGVGPIARCPVEWVDSGRARSPTTGPGCPTAGGRSSPPARRSGRCSTTTSATRLGELADGCCAPSAGRRPAASSSTDEVRTVVAGHAAAARARPRRASYDGVGTIVVRAGAMRRRAGPTAGPVARRRRRTPRAGRRRGPPRRRPDDGRWTRPAGRPRNPRLGRDVVLHEFAHKLDMLDGTIDGTPPIADDDRPAAVGRRVHRPSTRPSATASPDACCAPTPAPTRASSSPSPPRRSSPGRSSSLEADKPELYEVLGDFYRQDPGERVRRADRIGAYRPTVPGSYVADELISRPTEASPDVIRTRRSDSTVRRRLA